jgi:predicted SAM-dependent methyltransferase
MIQALKSALRKTGRSVVHVPLIGRLARIANALFWLPETRHQAADDHRLLCELADMVKAYDTYNDGVRSNLFQSLPLTLRTLSRDVKEAKQIGASFDHLAGRIEFVRRELMFEMRYGARAHSQSEQPTSPPRILSTDKVEASRKAGLRLNLGCGHLPLGDYVNVDRRELPHVDIVADVGDLPFGPGEVDEIYSTHVLEHFPQEQLRRELLPYWRSLLKPTGIFRAVVPDADFMMREYAKDAYAYDHLREVFFGAQDYDGDFHYNMFAPEQLSGLLSEAGFERVQFETRGRRNGLCFEMAVMARNAPP